MAKKLGKKAHAAKLAKNRAQYGAALPPGWIRNAEGNAINLNKKKGRKPKGAKKPKNLGPTNKKGFPIQLMKKRISNTISMAEENGLTVKKYPKSDWGGF